MRVKQVIVIRKDLKMRKGKMIAQGSHASMAPILQLLRNNTPIENFNPEIKDGKYTLSMDIEVGSPLDEWLRKGFTKVCVYVNSEEELLNIYKKAKEKNLPTNLITDSGRTEFGGVPTNTCIAIGPDEVEKIDEITGHLPLL